MVDMIKTRFLTEIAETQEIIRRFREALRAINVDRRDSRDQPRIPAGSPDGGQWTSGAGGQALSALVDMMARRGRSRAYCDAQYK